MFAFKDKLYTQEHIHKNSTYIKKGGTTQINTRKMYSLYKN